MMWRQGLNLLCYGIFALAVAATTNGCATSNRPAAQSYTISIPVKAADVTGLILPITDQIATNQSLDLGAIAGATAGLPNGTLQTARISPQSTIQIDLRALEAAVEHQATTMTNAAAAYLEVTPADTKFARVSTMPVWDRGADYGGAAGFLDSDDLKARIGLMFVDRPCRIIGTVPSKSGMKRVIFDATFTQKGLHWIVNTPLGPDRSIPAVGVPATVHPVLIFAAWNSKIWPLPQ
jgi:hypothetical protein